MKGLMKVSYDGLATWRGWRGIGSPKESMKEWESSRIKAVEMDNLRVLLGIRRMDRVPNAQIRELCRVRKGLDERMKACSDGSAMWRGWRGIGSPRKTM